MDREEIGVSKRIVFVIESHPIVSFGLVELIKDLAPSAKVHQFSSLRDASFSAQEAAPSLIVSDFYLRDVSSSEFFPLVERLFPRVPVFVSSNDDKVMQEMELVQDDRFKLFSKDTQFPILIKLLRDGLRAAGFQVPLSNVNFEAVKPRHAAHSRIGVGGQNKPLTRKQVEVLDYICSGMSNREIAQAMKISAETVKGHVKDILERLQVKNRLEAAVFYRQAIRQHAYME